MRAAITGARGFIGRHLSALLKHNGHSVLAIDLPELDITLPENVLEALRAYQPDHVYHLAAQASARRSWSAPSETSMTNVVGTTAVLNAMLHTGCTARIMIISSASIFDGKDFAGRISESFKAAPASPYGKSKAMIERLAQDYRQEYGVDVVIARPFNVIGLGQSGEYVVPSLAQRVVSACKNGATTIDIGNVYARRDFVDVRDAVEAMMRIMSDGRSGAVYNICSGTGVNIGEVAQQLITLSGHGIELRQDLSLQRSSDQKSVVGDPSLMQCELGWSSRVPLVTTLTDVLDECNAKYPGC